MSLNHICVMGRFTKDPELKHTPGGVAVTSFTLAVGRDYAPNGQEKEVDYIDIVAWRHTAEFVCKYFSKGRMAIANGRLQIRPWTDRDGNKRQAAEIIAGDIYFGDSKRNTDEGPNTGFSQNNYGNQVSAQTQFNSNTFPDNDYESLSEDDLPF